MNFRTDLALEVISDAEQSPNITQSTRGEAFTITEICINSDEHGALIGKKKGKYITLEGDNLSHFSDNYELMTEELCGEILPLIPDKGQVLVIGLGNSDITPDALGPAVASKILATRHLKEELAEEEFLASLRPVSVLATGVLGQTGIETAEIVRALCDKINPSAVIVIDALACSELTRLGTTIQISDAGISPGSGVQNKRKELSRDSLGIPVIAIGVPTVVDMHTILNSLGSPPASKNIPNMMVTPRDIDRLIERATRIIACGINRALQPTMTFEDIESMG